VSLERRGKFFHYRFMLHGRLRRGSTKETTLGKARQFEATLITKLREGFDPTRKVPVLKDFAKRFMLHVEKRYASGSYKRTTLRAYRNGCMLLSSSPVWNMPLDTIFRPTADELTFPGSPWNANRALATLRKMLSYAEEVRVIRSAPRIDKRKAQGRIRVFEPWMEALVLEFASPVLRDVLVIMLDCGMRTMEAMSMEWSHILWGDSTVVVPDGKTVNARRKTLLTERMRQMFAGAKRRNEKWKRAESPYVFPSPRSSNGHMSSLNKVWERTVERANAAAAQRGLPQLPDDLVPYSARHTFATEYYRATRDIAKLSRLLGHSDIQTTMIYMHLVEAGESSTVMDAHNARKLEIVKRRA
jgi:integrase